MSGKLAVLAVGAAALVAAGWCTAAHAGAPATVIARVVQREAWQAPGSGEARFLVTVDEVLSGWLPASAVVVSVDGSSPWFGRFRPGAELHLVVDERADGSYAVRRARPWMRPGGTPHDPFPPPLAPESFDPGDGPRRARALSTDAAYVQEVVELVNEARWDNGQLPPLKQVAELHGSAGTHSFNMADRDFFAHCDPDTDTQAWDRMTAAGYVWNAAGENIAAWYQSPADVMAGWMASEGHRANILDTVEEYGFREIGVGYEYQSDDQADVRRDLVSPYCDPDSFNNGPYYRYWVQNFGRRTNVYPVVIDREAAETDSTTVDLYVYGEGWAVDMCFSNDGSTWSAWEPYVADKEWTLSSGNGEKTVHARIRNGVTVREASDTILLNAGCPYPDTVELTGETVDGTQVHHACVLIAAGPDFVVDDGGDVTCHAPTVALRNGFSVLSGGIFVAGE